MFNRKDLYLLYAQLLTQTESITWTRLNNFLVCNSILVLAWATIFAPGIDCAKKQVVEVAICILGAASCIEWAGLGVRGRAYLNQYKQKLQQLEKENGELWPDNIPPGLRPLHSEPGHHNYDTSTFLMKVVPWGFFILYVVLIVVSLLP